MSQNVKPFLSQWTHSRACSVAVLVLNHANTLSLAAAIDPLRAANRRSARELYRWDIFTADDADAVLTSNIKLAANPLSTITRADLLIVVAGFRLEELSTPSLLRHLREAAPKVQAIAGVDGGSWPLARAGLLDGHSATTHWEDLSRFADSFPKVRVKRDRYVVSETHRKSMITTGGAAPCLDFMLHMISCHHGEDIAAPVARAFVYDPIDHANTPQSLVPQRRLDRKAPLIAKATRIMEANLDAALPSTEIAQQIGVSTRHFERQFAAATGQTPAAFYRNLRLQEAYRLAVDTTQSVQNITLETGFQSQASFARAFHRRFGKSVSMLRGEVKQSD